MTPLEKFKAERDELAEKYVDDLTTYENWFDQNLATKNYAAGFNAALRSSAVRELVEALEFYATLTNWRTVTVEDTHQRYCIMSGTDLEFIRDLHSNSYCGKRARIGVANFNEILKEIEK